MPFLTYQALLNLGGPDPWLRVAAYKLLCAVKETFQLQIDYHLDESHSELSQCHHSHSHTHRPHRSLHAYEQQSVCSGRQSTTSNEGGSSHFRGDLYHLLSLHVHVLTSLSLSLSLVHIRGSSRVPTLLHSLQAALSSLPVSLGA